MDYLGLIVDVGLNGLNTSMQVTFLAYTYFCNHFCYRMEGMEWCNPLTNNYIECVTFNKILMLQKFITIQATFYTALTPKTHYYCYSYFTFFFC